MNVTVNYEDFASRVAQNGFTPSQYSKSVYFAKTPNAGTVALNLNNFTFTVGVGTKHLEVITAAVEAAGWTVVKRVKGWSIVAIDPSAQCQDAVLGQFMDVVLRVIAAVPAKAEKIKTVKMSTIVKKVGKSFAMTQAIKAHNLETMKAVALALKAA